MESGKCGCGPWGNTDTYGEAQRPGWYGTTFHVPTSKVQGPRSKVLSLLCCPRTMESVGIIFNRYVPRMPRSFLLFYCSSSHLYLPIQGIYRKGLNSTHPRSVVQRTSAPSDHAPLPPIGGAPFPLTVFGSPVPSPRRRSTRSLSPVSRSLRRSTQGEKKWNRRIIEGGMEQIDKVR